MGVNYQEFASSWVYLAIGVVTTCLELNLVFYEKLYGPETSSNSNTPWISLDHYQYEVLTFYSVTCLMTGLCIADCILYIPVTFYHEYVKPNKPTGGFRGCYLYQTYLHHVLGFVGMLGVIAFVGVYSPESSSKHFDLQVEFHDQGPQGLFEKIYNQYPETDSNGNSTNAPIQTTLSTIRFANRFIYITEFSTVFMYLRGFSRMFSKGQHGGSPIKVPSLVRLFVDYGFAVSFFSCRIFPMPFGINKALNVSELISGADGYSSSEAILLCVKSSFLLFCLLNWFWASEIIRAVVLRKKGKADPKNDWGGEKPEKKA